MNLSRLLRQFSLVLLTVLVLPTLTVKTAALTPYGYSMSQGYKASVYYKNLTALTLTGNDRSDVLMVALSQLGYHEGNGDSDFGGKNADGSKNFVEYNRLAGKLDNDEGNGMSYGYAWCASFVNWCLRQAGVPKTVAGGEVSCSRWIRDFLKPSGIWKPSASTGGSYTPQPADLIFFRRSGSNSLSTHVGLVLYTDGTYVYTVEGNTAENAVALAKYELSDPYVIGYGAPRYETDGLPTADYRKSGTANGVYIVTADSLYVRAGSNMSARILGGLKKSDTVTVLGFENGYARIVWEGGTAYTSRHYLTLVAEAAPEPQKPTPPTETDPTPPVETEPSPPEKDETTDGTEDAPQESHSPEESTSPEAETPPVDSAPAEPPSQADTDGIPPQNPPTEEMPPEDAPHEDVYPVTEAGCGAVLSPASALLLLPLPLLLFARKKRD